jgi:hypothetical protein
VTYTTKDVIEVLNKIVEDVGDMYTYQDRYEDIAGTYNRSAPCLYSINEKPGCIVGEVMHRLDIDIPSALNFAWGDTSTALINGVPLEKARENAKALQKNFTRKANVLLSGVQVRQDNGETWKAAVSGAISAID